MAGLQTITAPVTGTPISTTTFGTPVKNNVDVLANPPTAKMRNSTGQSIANSTPTALTWDTEDFDSVGGHSTVTNTSRYTVQAGYAGKYRIHACAYWSNNATGVRELWFEVNGADVAGAFDRKPSTTTAAQTSELSTIVQLSAGDYVEVWVQQTSGGALALLTGGGTTHQQSSFDVQWISQ